MFYIFSKLLYYAENVIFKAALLHFSQKSKPAEQDIFLLPALCMLCIFCV